MHDLTVYEQPLNERMRLLMRLESMFNQMRLFHRADDFYEIQLFLDALFDVLDFLHRYEIRSELIKELQRYKAYYHHRVPLAQVGAADTTAIIEQRLDAIHQLNLSIINALRENELFNSLRQRSFRQSGNCLFEVPAYQFWLSRRERHADFLQDCYARFLPIETAIALILRLVREGSAKEQVCSTDGIYVRTLNSQQTNQLIRIHLPQTLAIFPRVSGDKHRFAIRFMQQDNPFDRACQITTPVDFALQICAV